MARADELLKAAGSDPRRTLQDGSDYLEDLEPGDYYEQAVTLRALSLAARYTSEIADSISYAARSSAVAKEAGLRRIELLATLTLTGSLAISGDLEGALAIIESVLAEVEDEEMQAEFGYQRAAVLSGLGHFAEAIESFENILPVYEALDDSQSMMMTLNQLGRLHTSVGDLSEAERYLERALSLARENSERASLPGILHNLGLLSAYQGDIPAALQRLHESDEMYMSVSGSDAPQHVARCEVLMSVGLFEEALETAKAIAQNRAEREDREHEVHAWMVAARAALLARRHEESIQLARRAEAVADLDEAPILLEARAMRIEATFELEGPSERLLNELLILAAQMAEEGLAVVSLQAKSLAARVSLELGLHERTIGLLREIGGAAVGPIELRLQGSLARARLAAMEGDRRLALRAARAGLAMIDRYQATLGSTELRHGIEKQGRELAEFGLSLSVEAARPRQILDWLDRSRARALRLRPVIPPADEDSRALFAELRRLSAELREPGRAGDQALVARRRATEGRIVTSQRTLTAVETESADFSVDALVDRLGGTALYEIGVIGQHLFAVRIEDGRVRRVGLGEVDEVELELRHVRFSMRRSARRGRSIDKALLANLALMLMGSSEFGEETVVVVPPPNLMALPWAALPSLLGHSVVVAPSAEMWWRATKFSSVGEGVVVAGGPDLVGAADEVHRVGALYDRSVVLVPGASVDEVSGRIEGSAIAHIACHASFQHENPMFSSLRLGDGDLNVYDIERLERPPSLVVLSACDSGYTEARAGDELAGLTSALLSMGTRTVVASVGLVPDSPATSDLMVDFHKGLVAGLEPAAALAAAQEKAFDDPERFVSAASFICVGA